MAFWLEGGGGGLKLGPERNEFSAASQAAVENAVRAYGGADADWLAAYDADPNLVVELTNTSTNPDTLTQWVRRGGDWVDLANVVVVDPSNAAVQAGVQAGVKAFARSGGPLVPEGEIDPAIARDNEITRDFLLRIIGLTQAQLDAVFIGARVQGAGASRTVVIDQKGGSTISLNLGDTTGGGGGGGGSDGVVNRVAFSADGMTLTLGLSTGGEVSGSIPALLRQSGLSQGQVQALIDAAEADDLDASDVAMQISAALAAYRRLPGIVEYSQNTIVPAANRGWTYRATGNTTRLLSIPNASWAGEVPDGWDMVASNGSTVDQSISPNGADTIGGNAGLTLAPGRAVRLQKVATGVWIVVADTKDVTGTADRPNVVNVATAFNIPVTAFGDTYRITGNVSRTGTLPDPDDVPVGWFVRVANGSAATAHSIAREGAGQTIEGGNGPLALPAGQSLTIQKVNTSEWELIADTSKAAATTGGALSLSTPLTDAQKKAWRAHLGAWHLDFTDDSTLPAIANYNGPDGVILGASGDTSVGFRDISELGTVLTAGVAGDLMILLSRGWTRVTNLFTGGAAVAAVRAIAEANRDRLMVSLTQGDFFGGSAAAIQGTYHINVESMPGAFPAANVVQVWIGDPGISRVLSQAWTPGDIQRNLEFEIDATVADNIATNGLVDIGDELGIEIRLIAPGAREVYRKGFNFPVVAKPASAQVRFKRALGASPVVLPLGTEEITGHVTIAGRSDRHGFSFDVDDLPTASADVGIDQKNFSNPANSKDSLSFRLTYTPATRTLAYALSPNCRTITGGSAVTIAAIRARGYA